MDLQKIILRTALTALLLAPLFFLAPVFTRPSDAAETVELKDLLKEAGENNAELKAFEARAKAMEARSRAEGALEDPTFRVEIMDISRESPLSSTPGQIKYLINQAIPFPGKRSLKEDIAMKEARAAENEYRAMALKVSKEVKEAYFDYAYLAESIRITEEIKGVLSNMAQIAVAKYSTGLASQQDAIKADVEITALTNDIITLEAEKEISAAMLKSLLNRDQSSPIGDPQILPRDRVAFDIKELIERAMAKNPGIKAIELEAEATEKRVDLADRDYYPDFMVGAGPVQTDGRFDSFDVMFQVSIPLWRSKYDSRALEASSNARSLKSRLISERSTTGLDVKGAALKVEAAGRMRELYETSLIPQVELSFDSALKNYRAGKTDFLTLLDTERDLKKARLDYLKIILDYRKRVAALESAVGEDLPETAADTPLMSGMNGGPR